MWLLLVVGLCSWVCRCSLASGAFEVQILGVQNSRGRLLDGSCCGGVGVGAGGGVVCPMACATFFRVCLKEYQEEVVTKGPCTFGNTSSQVLGGNTFTLTEPDRFVGARLVVPFTFRWTRSVTLILEAVDHNNNTQPYSDAVIERTVFKGIVNPGSDWHTMTHPGSVAQFTYRVRVLCDLYYFNSTCTKFCRPRDDYFGHYHCDARGDKVCLPGWTGTNCYKAMCKAGCHTTHGYCEKPGDCKCRRGWQGSVCDKCAPHPGCKHGSCEKPWECTCFTNWGGMLCDQDLNYCGTHEPCLNGGTCENTAPDQYMCRCPKGFSGVSCAIAENPCVSAPCFNGGICSETNGGFSCTCARGYTGDKCQTSVGFVGSVGRSPPHPTHRLDVDECVSSKPCINAVSCSNLKGDFTCNCQAGWTGKTCNVNVNDCRGQCANGATCIDLVNDYYCACLDGYTGRDCRTNIDECGSSPCLNGGECVDLVQSFKCICSFGFAGKFCEVDNDLCNPNPCSNNMACSFNRDGDYYCHCSEEWEGKNCSVRRRKTQCSHPPCNNNNNGQDEVLDSCLVPSNSSSPSVQSGQSQLKFVPSNICGDHGRCVSDPSDGSFACTCDPGYTGLYCHQNINDCAQNLCQHGGTCVDDVNSFRCICTEGWEGQLCSINKNECARKPCKNNGTCVDLTADFICQCKFGWKGKTCSLRHSHCDSATCSNGGTCEDLGSQYVCHCKDGWGGNNCQIAKNPACASNPCQNGATCINIGDAFMCICRDGFDGPVCERNIDDCHPYPCYNGGKCVDGINSFECKCPKGFTGPDCRKIKRCSSSPCAYGSTCIEGLGEFRCVCPPGKTGHLCHSDLDHYCSWKGQLYSSGSTWINDCNTCKCVNTTVHCSKVWCGLPNCLANETGEPLVSCEPDQVCARASMEFCFRPPCQSWGECRPRTAPAFNHPYFIKTDCVPNNELVSSNCARISLLFDQTRLPRGTSVRTLCFRLRSLPVLNNPMMAENIYIMCDIKRRFEDMLEVTVSTSSNSQDSMVVTEIAKSVADYVSRKLANSTALMAVMEVKVETAVLAKQPKNTSYIIALICSPLAIAILLALILLVLWHNRRKRKKPPNLTKAESCDSSQTDVKSNNQNEENLRRYCNPLNMKGCTMVSSDSTEMLEISFDDKSVDIPSRIYKAQTPDARKNTNVLPSEGLPKKNCDKEMNLKKVQQQQQQQQQDIQRTIKDKELIV